MYTKHSFFIAKLSSREDACRNRLKKVTGPTLNPYLDIWVRTAQTAAMSDPGSASLISSNSNLSKIVR